MNCVVIIYHTFPILILSFKGTCAYESLSVTEIELKQRRPVAAALTVSGETLWVRSLGPKGKISLRWVRLVLGVLEGS